MKENNYTYKLNIKKHKKSNKLKYKTKLKQMWNDYYIIYKRVQLNETEN